MMAKFLGGASLIQFVTLCIVFHHVIFCAANNFENNLLRSKRQTTNDLKNQYQSISQNATNANSQPNSANSTERSLAETSIVVPYNPADHPLLGANGTGQRQDASDKQVKATNISEPIQLPNSADGAGKKPIQFPKKAPTATLTNADSTPQPETSAEKVVDNIDIPENETVTALENYNYTVNQTTDHHDYYNSTTYVNKAAADQIWNVVKNFTSNSLLSQSHRRAVTVELSFDFPFYGHNVRNITVATGGFLYTGQYVHSWLAATQYIAPLMANFDTSLSEDSYVRFNDNGTSFTVVWENVSLQDKQEVGTFTFSTTLHKNGDIVFAYFKLPILINAIQDNKHPVKVGLSDAYIIDKVVFFARRKTIYEYHRVSFANAEITNSTIVYLTALPTCPGYTDCVSCINHETTFSCTWCPMLNRCSTGTDRKKQDWLQKGCDRAQITDVTACPALGDRGNNANQTNKEFINANNNSIQNFDNPLYPLHETESDKAAITPVNMKPVSAESKASLDEQSKSKSMGVVLSVFLPICLVLTVALWILYAYRNPHTKSGQLLIQYRPSQWSWRRGEARYTAATIHM